jgi:hypothetical protein
MLGIKASGPAPFSLCLIANCDNFLRFQSHGLTPGFGFRVDIKFGFGSGSESRVADMKTLILLLLAGHTEAETHVYCLLANTALERGLLGQGRQQLFPTLMNLPCSKNFNL